MKARSISPQKHHQRLKLVSMSLHRPSIQHVKCHPLRLPQTDLHSQALALIDNLTPTSRLTSVAHAIVSSIPATTSRFWCGSQNHHIRDRISHFFTVARSLTLRKPPSIPVRPTLHTSSRQEYGFSGSSDIASYIHLSISIDRRGTAPIF